MLFFVSMHLLIMNKCRSGILKLLITRTQMVKWKCLRWNQWMNYALEAMSSYAAWLSPVIQKKQHFGMLRWVQCFNSYAESLLLLCCKCWSYLQFNLITPRLLQDANGGIWKLDLSFSFTSAAPEKLFSFHAGPILHCAASPMSHLVATIGVDSKLAMLRYIISSEVIFWLNFISTCKSHRTEIKRLPVCIFDLVHRLLYLRCLLFRKFQEVYIIIIN